MLENFELVAGRRRGMNVSIFAFFPQFTMRWFKATMIRWWSQNITRYNWRGSLEHCKSLIFVIFLPFFSDPSMSLSPLLTHNSIFGDMIFHPCSLTERTSFIFIEKLPSFQLMLVFFLPRRISGPYLRVLSLLIRLRGWSTGYTMHPERLYAPGTHFWGGVTDLRTEGQTLL